MSTTSSQRYWDLKKLGFVIIAHLLIILFCDIYYPNVFVKLESSGHSIEKMSKKGNGGNVVQKKDTITCGVDCGLQRRRQKEIGALNLFSNIVLLFYIPIEQKEHSNGNNYKIFFSSKEFLDYFENIVYVPKY